MGIPAGSEQRHALNALPEIQALSVAQVQSISSAHLNALKANVQTTQANLANLDAVLPESLKKNKVVHNVANLMVYQSLVTTDGFVTQTPPLDAQVGKPLSPELRESPAYLVQTDVVQAHALIADALNKTKPERLTTGSLTGSSDFKDFLDALVSPNGTGQQRVVEYESYYYNGNFVDRFGTKLQKPTLSLTVSDQEMSGALTAFLEAIADDIFSATPVWVGTTYSFKNNKTVPVSAAVMAAGLQDAIASSAPAGITVGSVNGTSFTLTSAKAGTGFISAAVIGKNVGNGTIADMITTPNDDGGTGNKKAAQVDTITLGLPGAGLTPFNPGDSVFEIVSGNAYYPGGTANEPSFAVYAASNHVAGGGQALLVPYGCGMTKLKADALGYLSGKAATWAAGESGLILGSAGGANIGLPIVLGKLSIGDNKTLQTLVQTILSFAARRATFEAAIPVLWKIDQPANSTITDLIDNLVFKSPSQ
ncbi:hypothetical protein BCY88_21000 [Paraburkholderia fungorum]|uniref:Uncharacterized protein n=2 Tax=Paraburkholderia fungorum TaxID=134537 RepID=A0A3R7FAC3_9BURK|nr:hypothetical protein BCY88_21000 [Paraburkholderia fungorum]